MTKLTIQLDWKTFVPNGDINYRNIGNFITDYISLGYLVELQPQEGKAEETERKSTFYIKIDDTFCEWEHEMQASSKYSIKNFIDTIESNMIAKSVNRKLTRSCEIQPLSQEPKETQEEVNYCDSRTDGERERDEELYKNSVTTYTSTAIADIGKCGGVIIWDTPVLQKPIKKLPEYKIQDWYVNEQAGELHKQVELLTSTLNTLIERINKPI